MKTIFWAMVKNFLWFIPIGLVIGVIVACIGWMLQPMFHYDFAWTIVFRWTFFVVLLVGLILVTVDFFRISASMEQIAKKYEISINAVAEGYFLYDIKKISTKEQFLRELGIARNTQEAAKRLAKSLR